MNTLKHDNIKYEIASPCDQNWADMSGDDKCRFCSLCEKSVYNLSSMSSNEVTELLAGDSNVCTRVFKRPDGTVLTEDCPVGLAQVRSHLKKKKFAAAALCLVAILFSSLTVAGQKNVKGRMKIMGKMVAPSHYQQEEVKPVSIETVGPEEDWDYKNKAQLHDDVEMMGEMIAEPID